MRNLVSSPFHSVRAFLGYLLIFIAPLWAAITFLGNVDLVMSYAEPIVGFLHSWWGVIALIISGFALLAWDNYKRHSVSATSPSSSDVVEQSPTPSETDQEEVNRLRIRLGEVEQERDSLKGVNEGQHQHLGEWEGERRRFREFLTEAWSEGIDLRGSKPSKEEAREWESRVRHLLEQAVGKEVADRVLRHDPQFQSADFDASDAQKFLEMRLHRVEQLRNNVANYSAIPFRSGFDPYEWEDWKTSPQVASATPDD